MLKPLFFIAFLFFLGNTYAQSLNDSLVQQLAIIRESDQVYRGQLDSIQTRFASDTTVLKKQLAIVFAKMKIADSSNLIAVARILEQRGWPTINEIGLEGSSTIFLVIQHADLPQQKHYLPVVREAVKQEKLKPSSLALLEDRIALREGRKQLYGTQVLWDMKRNTYLMIRLEDPDNVDKRRAAIGLPPLDVYLQGFGTRWDVEAYKKSALQEQKLVL